MTTSLAEGGILKVIWLLGSACVPTVPPSKDAGFAVTAIVEEYTHQPADASTLRATWTARLLPR